MKTLFSKMMVAGLALALSSICLMGCEPSKDAEGSVSVTVKDADGNTYTTVKIGNQIWMAKNLNVDVEGSMCYDNDPANCEKYGRLYTWEAAKRACPDGWHLPSKEDFKSLLDKVGSSDGERSANLRAPSWAEGEDKYGFSALPAGSYYSDYEEFDYLGYYAYFWSSTERDESYAYSLDIDGGSADVDNNAKDYGRSVRCLKDN